MEGGVGEDVLRAAGGDGVKLSEGGEAVEA